jgi:hypothetical protein
MRIATLILKKYVYKAIARSVNRAIQIAKPMDAPTLFINASKIFVAHLHVDSVPKMKSVLRECVLLKSLRPHRLLIANINVKKLTKSVLMVNAGTNVKSTTYVSVKEILTVLITITAITMVLVLHNENVKILAIATKECFV